ncbi:hypothetical protein [Flavobacterium sp. YO64]|uniref:hypothetical protein n=1 Tax=Flavobacterium sp. YO64 TaxID=394559 RepID=UPI00100C1C83|nr:hypothetical protein [Flavobacterium sp. YO64]RXM41593.1 hypothetical protein BOW57_20360 [Flavobacterium sp. YO64]
MIINDLNTKLYEGTNIFKDSTINLKEDSSFNSLYYENLNQLRFVNCIFNGNLEIENFQNKIFKLIFKDCTFNGDILITDVEIDYLHFLNTKKINDIHIDGLFKRLKFNNKQNPLSGKIDIFAIVLIELNFNDLFLEKGELNLMVNETEKDYDYQNFYSSFENAKVDNWINTRSYFPNFANFKEIQVFTKLIFNDCKFDKVVFASTDFGKSTSFNDCKFYAYTGFEECKNLNNSELKFISCKFEKYSFFDNSKFNKIEFSHSKFLEKASFENFETNNFKIHQVTFAGTAYFDDLNKTNNSVIEKWDRKTIRAIKRELVNTHNQIDYLRFKAYELNAYKKEKNKNWRDSFILFFNKHSNYFGLDWTKGFVFTGIIGLIFYLLYLCTYAIVMKNTLYFPHTIEDFFVGYLKFLNPFSLFKSPIENAETYFFPLLFFMIGKIFISYGIVQTVQAFRKFGVNGG